ncbi:MAG: glycosyltransferase family 2 protein [Pseudomonadota bacterium]
MTPTLSVIVTTYNWPEALKHVLLALAKQMKPTDEVLIADDGSDAKTEKLIRSVKAGFPCPLKHIWHEDRGFRAAAIRNRAIAQTRGQYVVFLDGDCVPLPHTIEAHRHLAESGWFVSGNRILSTKAWSERLLLQSKVAERSLLSWLFLRCTGKINRVLPACALPLGSLRKRSPTEWEGAKTCNLGVWRADLIRVNGFDEGFEGWGYEDSELVARLIHNGIQHKNGRFGTGVLHFWHPERARDQEKANWQRFIAVVKEHKMQAIRGIQHLEQPVS